MQRLCTCLTFVGVKTCVTVLCVGIIFQFRVERSRKPVKRFCLTRKVIFIFSLDISITLVLLTVLLRWLHLREVTKLSSAAFEELKKEKRWVYMYIYSHM